MPLKNKPAFPWKARDGCNQGMTLREYYAGLAMQGLMSPNDSFYTPEGMAEYAIAAADALIEVLEKKDAGGE